MLKEKYYYKDFIEVMLLWVKHYDKGTQAEEYIDMLFSCLCEYFEIDIKFEKFNDDDNYMWEGLNVYNKGLEQLKMLIIDYNNLRDIFEYASLRTTGILEDINRKYKLDYTKNLIKMKRNIFDMIFWLCKELYGYSKKNITHDKLKFKFLDIYNFECKIDKILNSIYHEKTLKSSDCWSVFYNVDELAERGYTCIIPEPQTNIIIGSFELTSIKTEKAFMIRPINVKERVQGYL